MAESERGVWFWLKSHSICTPHLKKIERTSSLFSGGGKPILPPNSGAQVSTDSWAATISSWTAPASAAGAGLVLGCFTRRMGSLQASLLTRTYTAVRQGGHTHTHLCWPHCQHATSGTHIDVDKRHPLTFSHTPHVPQKTASCGHTESAESAYLGPFLARQSELPQCQSSRYSE